MPERHNVVVFDSDGFWHYAAQGLDAERAVLEARSCVHLAEHGALDAAKIIITDEDDFTNFLWERGKGVIYPPPPGAR